MITASNANYDGGHYLNNNVEFEEDALIFIVNNKFARSLSGLDIFMLAQ